MLKWLATPGILCGKGEMNARVEVSLAKRGLQREGEGTCMTEDERGGVGRCITAFPQRGRGNEKETGWMNNVLVCYVGGQRVFYILFLINVIMTNKPIR